MSWNFEGLFSIVNDFYVNLRPTMEYKRVRNLIALTFFIIFLYSCFTAISVFIESPTVVIQSETTWDKIQKPRNCALFTLIRKGNE